MKNSNQELTDFINQPIPQKKTHSGFLEIIQKQYHENINSSLYAYFINQENTTIRSWFMDALQSLLYTKSNIEISLSSPYAETEVSTGQGRIDIVIHDANASKAIIIENKLNSWLHNDLADYWNHISTNEKVGVYLTLHPDPITNENGANGNYTNITHLEWANEVANRWQLDQLTERERIYLEDFIYSIQQISKPNEMNESAKFYFENIDQVKAVNKTMYDAHAFINAQLQFIAQELNWSTYGSSMDWRNIWDSKNHLDTFLTILTKDLLDGNQKYTVIVELIRKDMERIPNIKNKFSDNQSFQALLKENTTKGYSHLLAKEYKIDADQLGNLGQHILENIRKDFGTILVEIIKFNYPEMDISRWEDKLDKKYHIKNS